MEKECGILLKKMEENFNLEIPNDSKRRIIENAIEVFARRGLAGTRISDIAKKAGFSQGFVYNHFKSKDDIFIEITRLASSGSLKVMAQAAKLCGTPYKKVFWLAEALTMPGTIAQLHFRYVLMQTVSYESIPDEAKEIFKDSAKNQIMAVAEILAEGRKTGEIANEDPVKLAFGYFAILQGIAIMRMQSEKVLPLPDLDRLLSFLKKNN